MSISLKERLGEERYYAEALRLKKEWFEDAKKMASRPPDMPEPEITSEHGERSPRQLASAIAGVFDRAENCFLGMQLCHDAEWEEPEYHGCLPYQICGVFLSETCESYLADQECGQYINLDFLSEQLEYNRIAVTYPGHPPDPQFTNPVGNTPSYLLAINYFIRVKGRMAMHLAIEEHRKDPSKNWYRIHGILGGSCQKTHDALQEKFDRELELRKDPTYVPLSEFCFNPLYDQEIKRRERQFLEKEAIMNSPIRRTWHFHKKAMIRITTVAIVVLSYAKYNNIYRDFAFLQRMVIEIMAR